MIFRRQNRRDRQVALSALEDAMARVQQRQPAPWTPPSPEGPVAAEFDPCGAGPVRPADTKSTGGSK